MLKTQQGTEVIFDKILEAYLSGKSLNFDPEKMVWAILQD